MVYEVKKFSPYEDRRFLVRAEGRNISAIHDRLIRLAAKITENYAGDIFHEMVRLREALAEGKEFWVILGFRENGVDAFPAPKLMAADEGQYFQLGSVWVFEGFPSLCGVEYLQFWSLRHVPATPERNARTTLVRVWATHSPGSFIPVEDDDLRATAFL